MFSVKCFTGVPILVTLVLLCGCATTPAQQRFLVIRERLQYAAANLKACSSAVYDDPEYASVREHLPADVREVTQEQLEDRRFVSVAEVSALNSMHPKLQACRSAYLSQISQVAPTLVPILTQGLAANEDALLELMQHRLRWGEYAMQARDTYQAMIPKVAAEAKRIEAEIEREN